MFLLMCYCLLDNDIFIGKVVVVLCNEFGGYVVEKK